MALTFAFMLNEQFYFIILHNKSGAEREIPLLFCTHVGVTLRKPNMWQMTVDCGHSYRSCSLRNKEIVIRSIKVAVRWKAAVFWPKYHPSFPFRCIQRASSKQLLLFRQAEKEASHWPDICMYFQRGRRSGSAPLAAFLFNHRSHINARDEERW